MKTSCTLFSHWSYQVTFFTSVVFILVLSTVIPTTLEESLTGNSSPVRSVSTSSENSETGRHAKVSQREDRSGDRSAKVTGSGRSQAVDSFLENVLKSRAELKWIDQAVARINEEKEKEKEKETGALKNHVSDKTSTLGSRATCCHPKEHQDAAHPEADIDYGNKFRDKRAFDRSYQTLWMLQRKRYGDEDAPNFLKDYSPGDVSFSNDWHRSDPDALVLPASHRESRRSVPVPLEVELDRDAYEKGALDDRQLDDFDNEQKDGPLSLASLKKTVLKLRKNLVGGVKKLQNSTKNFFAGKSSNKKTHTHDGSKEDATRKRDKHESNVLNSMVDNGFMIDLKNSEEDLKNPKERDAAKRVWSVKRAKINSDHGEEGAPKLFERGSLAATKLENEERKLEGASDHESLGKGSTEEEKRYLNEHSDKTWLGSGNKSASMAPCFAQNRGPINTRILPDEMAKDSRNASKDTANLSVASTCDSSCDASQGTSLLSDKQRDNTRLVQHPANIQESLRYKDKEENNQNREKSNVSHDLDMMENKPRDGHQAMQAEKEGGGPWGNSLQNFGVPRRNELQPDSAKTFSRGEGNREEQEEQEEGILRTRQKEENVGLDREAQVIKVEEPQGHLFQNIADTKGPERIGRDEELRKSYRQTSRDKEPKGESGNIKIVVKTMKKNVLQFPNDRSSSMQVGSEKLHVNNFLGRMKKISRQRLEPRRESNFTNNPKEIHLHLQRKLLEIAEESESRLDSQEYLNDAEEDELNYDDSEEQDEAGRLAVSNAELVRRDERSAKGKVNVLIKQKIKAKKKKPTDNVRKRRNSKHMMQYYDYDVDLEQQENENSLVDSNNKQGLHEDGSSEQKREDCNECKVCEPVAERKKNEHEEATKKENDRKAEMGNKGLKEQIIVHVDRNASKEVTSSTFNPTSSPSLTESDAGDRLRFAPVNENSGNFNRRRLRHQFSNEENGRRHAIPIRPKAHILFIDDRKNSGPRQVQNMQNQQHFETAPIAKNYQYNNNKGPRISTDDLKGPIRPTNDDLARKGSGTVEMEENTYFAISANYSQGAGLNTNVQNKCSASQNREPSKELGNFILSRQGRSAGQENQLQISANNIQESFVDPASWMDDFDDSSRIRLGRSLQSIDDNLLDSIEVGNDDLAAREQCRSKFLTTTEIDLPLNATSTLGIITPALDDLSNNLNDETPLALSIESERLLAEERARSKRDAESPDNPLYDDTELTQHDSNKLEDLNKGLDDGNSEFSDYNDESAIETRQAGHKKRPTPRRHKGHRKRKHKHGRKGRRKHRKKGPKKHRYRRHHKGSHSGKNRGIKKHKHNQKQKNQGKPKAVHVTNISKSKKREDEVPVGNTTVTTGDSQRGKIRMLLRVDGIEDESQMKDALHGELAGQIVDHIFEQVQRSNALKSSLGPGLRRQHKVDDAISAAQKYRESLDKDDVKRTEEQLKKVMGLLSQMVLEEVHKKSCVSLSPDLKEFLDWLLGVEGQNYTTGNTSLMLEQTTDYYKPQNNMITHTSPHEKITGDVNELYNKIDVLENLINEYNSLSEIDKEKVEPVHDYLVKRLDLLLEYIEATEKDKRQVKSSPIEGALANKAANENQSQASGSFSSGNSGPINEYFHNGLGENRKRARSVSSWRRRRKRGARKKPRKSKRWMTRSRKHRWGGVGNDDKESSRQKAAVLRRKREYSVEEEIRDPFDSGYAEAATYRSADTLNAKASGDKRATQSGLEKHYDDRSQDIRGGGPGSSREKGRHTDVMNSSRGTIRNVTEANILKSVPVTRVDDAGNLGSVSRNGPRRRSSVPALAFISSPPKVEREGNNRLGGQGANEQDGPAVAGISLIINDTEHDDLPIKGKNRLEDEVILLNKREAWRRKNEEQLEEVAFGKDMRNKLGEEKLFERLTEIDKKKYQQDDNPPIHQMTPNVKSNNPPPITTSASQSTTNAKRSTTKRSVSMYKNSSINAPSEDLLRALESKINVYADRDDLRDELACD